MFLKTKTQNHSPVILCGFDSMRRQYVPLSLLSLQRLVDLGRVDVESPIDLSTICNTKVIILDPAQNHYGINLTDEVYLHPACGPTNNTHGSYGQGKSEKSENQKSWNFTFQSQAEIRGSGKVGENQSTRVQKLTKMQKKI